MRRRVMGGVKIYSIDDMEYGHAYIRRYGEDYFTDLESVRDEHVLINKSVLVLKPKGTLATILILLKYTEAATAWCEISEYLNSINKEVYCNGGPSVYSLTILWDNVYSTNNGVQIRSMGWGTTDTANNYIFIVDVIPK